MKLVERGACDRAKPASASENARRGVLFPPNPFQGTEEFCGKGRQDDHHCGAQGHQAGEAHGRP
eukprot:scaffold8409_cov248-Pinguiococcus_pyrenoidosus.AAC.2